MMRLKYQTIRRYVWEVKEIIKNISTIKAFK